MIQISGTLQHELEKIGVCALYLFGSRAEGTDGPLSDYDFAVLFRDSLLVKPGRKIDFLYQSLYSLLSDISPRTTKNDVIDIVFLQNGVSLELQAHVVKNGIILFENDADFRADYESQVMIRMADFRPILDIMDQSILSRL